MSYDGETVTLAPSVGNWSFACKSHYVIRRNEVFWLPRMSREKIDAGSERDRCRQGGLLPGRPSRRGRRGRPRAPFARGLVASPVAPACAIGRPRFGSAAPAADEGCTLRAAPRAADLLAVRALIPGRRLSRRWWAPCAGQPRAISTPAPSAASDAASDAVAADRVNANSIPSALRWGRAPHERPNDVLVRCSYAELGFKAPLQLLQ